MALMSDRTRSEIDLKCEELKKLLISKNRKYGDSALSPIRIFSKASSIEQLLVRCDDKINRVASTGIETSGEDQLIDLVGYLILLLIALDRMKEESTKQEESTLTNSGLGYTSVS